MKLETYIGGWGPKAYVLGHEFGAVMVAICDSLEEAIDEWDERHGRRVDVATDAADLADYGPSTEAAVEAAMNAGDIRVNDGGTTVWVNHYEWVREFSNVADAFAFAFGVAR